MTFVVTGSASPMLTVDLAWDENQTWRRSPERDWRQYHLQWQPNSTQNYQRQLGLWVEYGTGDNYTAAGPQVISARWAQNATNTTINLRSQAWLQAYTSADNYVTVTGSTLWDATNGTLWQNGILQSPELSDRYRREQEREKLQRARASKRGRKLLLSLLTEEQQRQYAATQCFTVMAADGLLYRLRKRKTTELVGPDGGSVANYCIHLAGVFCPEDNLIAVKFLLETDVAEFERIANITVIRDRLYKQIKSAGGQPRLLRAA